MTKERTPDSFPDAMTKVIARLGVPATAQAATIGAREVSERTIYEWSNPDSRTLPSLLQALALDAAYQLAGGEDAPFRDAFSQQLGITVDQQDACRRQLAAESIEFIREAGDLSAALFTATQPGASPRDHHRALVEAQQVKAVLRRLCRRLPSFLHIGAGPNGRGRGEP